MILILFWISVVLIIYAYFIFPVLVILRGFLWPQPFKSDEITPPVSVIIAAFNELRSIGDKIDNILTLDYPRDRFEVVIASDGSDDGTNEIVRAYGDNGVRLWHSHARVRQELLMQQWLLPKVKFWCFLTPTACIRS